MVGLFKVMSEYGRAEGLGMIVASIVVALMITTDVLNLEEPVVTKQMVEEVPETDLDEGIENEEEDDMYEDTQDDTVEVIEEVIDFHPIEPVYDTIQVVEEVIEETVKEQYDTLEVLEIESNEILDTDSLMTVYNADSVAVEILE
jgi:hypothetical protein